MASGRFLAGFFASPPAWAMESKPMNDEKSRAAAGRSSDDRCADRRGEILMVEQEPGHDHHATQQEGQEHQRDDDPLVRLDPADVDRDRGPEEPERNGHANGPVLELRPETGPAEGQGDVAQERHQDIRHDADRDAEGEPLGEGGDEPQVRIQSAARIDVAPARTGHRGSEDGVCQSRQNGRHSREEIRRQNVRADPRDVPLDHEGNDVDAGGGETEQAHFAGKSGACGVIG
jgi:hypothetical protein